MLRNAVRFGSVTQEAVAGEGIETVLSVRCAVPYLHHLAGLTANHLSAIELDPRIKRLWIAHDNDAEGLHALAFLSDRAVGLGIEAKPMSPLAKDHNEDLQTFITTHGSEGGRECFADRLRTILGHGDDLGGRLGR
jgi:hypothetical protein